MLLIIELLFLVAGIWAIVSGKIPLGLFAFLFGKGNYKLLPKQVRLLGILLLSPFPIAIIANIILNKSLGIKGYGYSILFEIIYILIVSIISIIIIKKARQPDADQINPTKLTPPPLGQKTRSYSKNLLIILGLVSTGCITTVGFGTLVLAIISSIRFGVRIAGDFWSDVFPFILLVVIIGLGTFGIIKLAKILRK